MFPSDITTKACTKCGISYPATAEYFHRTKTNPDGLQYWCKSCMNVYQSTRNDPLRQQRTKEKQERATARKAELAASGLTSKQAYYRANRDKFIERAKAREQMLKEARRPAVEARRERLVLERQQKLEREAIERTEREAARKAALLSEEEKAERNRAGYRRWYAENKARRAEATRLYKQNNPEKTREQRRKNKKSENGRLQSRTVKNRRRARIKGSDSSHSVADIRLQLKAQGNNCWWCGKRLKGEYDVDHRIPLARGGSNGPDNIVISCKACNNSKGAKLPSEWAGRLF